MNKHASMLARRVAGCRWRPGTCSPSPKRSMSKRNAPGRPAPPSVGRCTPNPSGPTSITGPDRERGFGSGAKVCPPADTERTRSTPVNVCPKQRSRRFPSLPPPHPCSSRGSTTKNQARRALRSAAASSALTRRPMANPRDGHPASGSGGRATRSYLAGNRARPTLFRTHSTTTLPGAATNGPPFRRRRDAQARERPA